MKYAAVAAALAGVALADSWAPVKPSTTKSQCSYVTEVPVKKCDPQHPDKCWDEKTKTTYYADTCTWADIVDPKKPASWSPVKVATTTKATTKHQCAYVTEVPVKKCDPNHSDKCWEEKTKTTIYADTCTWEGWYDPATKTKWEEAPAKPTTTGKCAYAKVVPIKKCFKDQPSKCWDEKTTTTIYADTCTWADVVEPITKTYWEGVPEVTTTTMPYKCKYLTEVPIKKCKKDKPSECIIETIKSTVYADTCTWADNVEVVTKTSYVDSVEATQTSWAAVSVITSVVPAGWTKDGWFGPAWPVATDKCAVNVVTSYGAPVWKPVPEVKTETWSTYVVPKVTETWSTYSAPAVTETVTWSTYDVVKATPSALAPVKGHAPIKPNGNQWSITYSPWDESSKCKTETVIKADIKKIADLGFTSVRIYSTKCESLKIVGDACAEYGLKIIIGVYIDKDGVKAEGNAAKKAVAEIITWGKWEIVELIVIGNEVLYQNWCTPEDLVWFIQDCKTKFTAAGYTGYCTFTEPLNMWEKHGSKFCSVVDVVAANLYAYFNEDTTCDNAGKFISSQIDVLAKICPGKETYVMESGWPSAGNANGKAVPGKKEQEIAIKSIKESCGGKVVFFAFEDELWKTPGQFGVEQHWGCSHLFNGSKPVTTTTWAAWTGIAATSTTTTKSADPTKWAAI